MKRYLWAFGLMLCVSIPAGAQLLEKPVDKKDGAKAAVGGKRDVGKAAGRAGTPAPQANAMFAVIDTDGDDVISKVELRKAIKALMTLDEDKDGSITLAEASAGGPAGPIVGGQLGADPQVAQLMMYDKNKDGKLSANEVPATMRAMLNGVDQNDDNLLSEQEIAAAVAASRNQGGVGLNGRWQAGGGNVDQQATGQFLRFDLDGNGVLTRNELPKEASRMLQGADNNRDGAIDAGELQAAIAQMGGRARAIGAGLNPEDGKGRPPLDRKRLNEDN